MIKRQRTSKSNAEIDISNALKKLSENEVKPIFLGTSNMVMQTPLFNPDAGGNETTATRLKILEETFNTALVPNNKGSLHYGNKMSDKINYSIETTTRNDSESTPQRDNNDNCTQVPLVSTGLPIPHMYTRDNGTLVSSTSIGLPNLHAVPSTINTSGINLLNTAADDDDAVAM